MVRYLFLAVFALAALTGCAPGNPWDSTVQNEDGTTRSRLAQQPSFVQAQDGTLYSIDCLRQQGSQIAAGVPGAGRNCAADQLSQEGVRGLRGYYGHSPYFYYLNPVHYYGGGTYYGSSYSNNFCSRTFGVSWSGCYSWLGYSPSYYNSQYYYPQCQDCVFTQTSSSTSSSSSMPQTCPNYCRRSGSWSSQPWYQNWYNWNWLWLQY